MTGGGGLLAIGNNLKALCIDGKHLSRWVVHRANESPPTLTLTRNRKLYLELDEGNRTSRTYTLDPRPLHLTKLIISRGSLQAGQLRYNH
jgi:hypothetical protein